MNNREKVETIIFGNGFNDFKWADPREYVVANWVRMKCKFGCDEYGQCAVCPPNMPSINECKDFFSEYSSSVVLRFAKKVDHPEDRKKWSKEINKELVELERVVFLSGYNKAFILLIDSCALCADCEKEKDKCKQPKTARPTPEAMGISVFDTVRKIEFPIEVLDDYDNVMNRYAFLLIE